MTGVANSQESWYDSFYQHDDRDLISLIDNFVDFSDVTHWLHAEPSAQCHFFESLNTYRHAVYDYEVNESYVSGQRQYVDVAEVMGGEARTIQIMIRRIMIRLRSRC